MPLYDFKCTVCGKVMEVFRTFKNAETALPILCEECGVEMERTVSQSNFTLKGSGWAKDGYAG